MRYLILLSFCSGVLSGIFGRRNGDELAGQHMNLPRQDVGNQGVGVINNGRRNPYDIYGMEC